MINSLTNNLLPKNINDNKITDKLSSHLNNRTEQSKFDKLISDNISTNKSESDSQTEKTKDKKLWNACKDMESLFIGKMLKEMKKTVHKGEMFHGGQPEEIFEDMLYDEYAKEVSNNSEIGIASMLYNQLSRNISS